MSEALGPLRYSENEEDVFLGRSVTQRKSMSDETANIIDEEIRSLVENAENHARKILKKHIKHLHSLADALLEFETLSGDEVRDLIKGKKKIVKDVDDDFSNKKTSMPKSSKNQKIKPKKNIPLNPGIVPGT